MVLQLPATKLIKAIIGNNSVIAHLNKAFIDEGHRGSSG